jgi:hypothetical protein
MPLLLVSYQEPETWTRRSDKWRDRLINSETWSFSPGTEVVAFADSRRRRCDINAIDTAQFEHRLGSDRAAP